MNKKENPKTRTEINRQNYLKNKQKIKAKSRVRSKVKYDQLHEGRYYSVCGLTTWKELWDEIEYQIENGEFQKRMNKAKPLSSRDINNLKLVACAIFSQMEDSEWYEGKKLYSSIIQKKANGISSKLLTTFYSFISNDNGLNIRKSRNPFYLSIVGNWTEIKNEDGDKVAMVRIRTAKPTKLLNKEETVDLNVQMTEKCYKNWKLLTAQEIKKKRDQVAGYKYDNYSIYKPKSEYKIDSTSKYYHTEFTESELQDIENFKQLRVDIGRLDQLIETKLKDAMERKQSCVNIKELEELLSGKETLKKLEIGYKEMLELSDLLTKLTPKNGLKITFSYGRIYFPIFTSIDKKFRYLFHRKQVFDAPTCFTTLNIVQYSQSKYRDEKTLKDLIQLRDEDIYITFGHRVGKGREAMKPLMNKWYFATKGGRKGLKKLMKEIDYIDQIMEEDYSTFYKFITNSVDEDTAKGKKNTLSVLNQWTENRLVLNNLYKNLTSNSKVTVHDAIYVDEDEWSEQLEKQLLDEWNMIFNNEIKLKSEQDLKFESFLNETIKDLNNIMKGN